jgi:hypothetical protein
MKSEIGVYMMAMLVVVMTMTMTMMMMKMMIMKKKKKKTVITTVTATKMTVKSLSRKAAKKTMRAVNVIQTQAVLEHMPLRPPPPPPLPPPSFHLPLQFYTHVQNPVTSPLLQACCFSQTALHPTPLMSINATLKYSASQI